MKINKTLEGKKIRLVCMDEEVFEGVVSDYIYPEDNEPEGIASIDIDNCPQRKGGSVSFYETEIKSFSIIK